MKRTCLPIVPLLLLLLLLSSSPLRAGEPKVRQDIPYAEPKTERVNMRLPGTLAGAFGSWIGVVFTGCASPRR